MNKNVISIEKAQEIWEELSNQPFPEVNSFRKIVLYKRLKNFINDFLSQTEYVFAPPGFSLQREIQEEDEKIGDTTIIGFVLDTKAFDEYHANIYVKFYYFYNNQFIEADLIDQGSINSEDFMIADVDESIRGDDSLFIAYDSSW